VFLFHTPANGWVENRFDCNNQCGAVMGLRERAKIKELQDVTMPARSEEIRQICGKAVPIDVDWGSLADDCDAPNFFDNLSLHRLCMALRMICTDDLSKQAVRDGLTSVRYKNVAGKDQMRMTLEAGVLELHCAFAQKLDGIFSEGEIRDLLSKKL